MEAPLATNLLAGDLAVLHQPVEGGLRDLEVSGKLVDRHHVAHGSYLGSRKLADVIRLVATTVNR